MDAIDDGIYAAINSYIDNMDFIVDTDGRSNRDLVRTVNDAARMHIVDEFDPRLNTLNSDIITSPTSVVSTKRRHYIAVHIIRVYGLDLLGVAKTSTG